MVSDEHLQYKIALSLIPKVGPIIAKRLIAYTGSPKAVFEQNKQALLKIPNVGDQMANKIISKECLKKAEEEIKFIEKYNIRTHFFTDDNYPERLKNCEDSPVIFYSKGNVDFSKVKTLSIVGTRKPTEEGLELCKKLVKDLAQSNDKLLIVSGLAYGIDICAHTAALEAGLKTVAILGHGLNTVYPSIHRKIAEKIVSEGALITEFKSNTKAIAGNFISRNRIIAGISDATVIVESGEKGGALITADIANSYNRDVFAFPGRVSDKYSKGCNQLIKSNKASLIESATDLEYLMGWEVQKIKQKTIQRKMFQELDEKEKEVLNFLKSYESIPIDHICQKMQQSTSQVSPILLELEFKGLVKSLPGKHYKIIKI